jgi:hypothetical protein
VGIIAEKKIQPPKQSVRVTGFLNTSNFANNATVSIDITVSIGISISFKVERCTGGRNYSIDLSFEARAEFNITLNATANRTQPDSGLAQLQGKPSQVDGEFFYFRFVQGRWEGSPRP